MQTRNPPCADSSSGLQRENGFHLFSTREAASVKRGFCEMLRAPAVNDESVNGDPRLAGLRTRRPACTIVALCA